jgi:hypothetical protein
MLEKEATKNTIFFEDFTECLSALRLFPIRSRKPDCAEGEFLGREPRTSERNIPNGASESCL